MLKHIDNHDPHETWKLCFSFSCPQPKSVRVRPQMMCKCRRVTIFCQRPVQHVMHWQISFLFCSSFEWLWLLDILHQSLLHLGSLRKQHAMTARWGQPLTLLCYCLRLQLHRSKFTKVELHAMRRCKFALPMEVLVECFAIDWE